jgi:RHS repeat-associated protein
MAGTKTTGDVLTVVFIDAGLSGGKESVSYTVMSGDTLSSITSGLASAINADSALQNIGVSASASGTQVTVQSNSPNLTAFRQSTSSGASETIGLTQPLYSWQIASIGGTKTTSDVLTVNVFDQALSGGKETVSYSVLSGDSLTSIAAALASAINGDTNLSNIGVSASSNSTVLSIESLSPNVTTYSQSVSSGATETIALANTTGVVQSAYNNVNELVSQAPGGATRFQATTNKAVGSAFVAGQTVAISATPANPTNFSTAVVGVGTETISLSAPPYQNGNTLVTIGGTPTVGDVLTISVNTVHTNQVPVSASYTVKSGDTTSSIASTLTGVVINDNYGAWAYEAGIIYNYPGSGNSFYLYPVRGYFLDGDSATFAASVVGPATDTLTTSADQNGNSSVTVGGSVTVGEQLSLTVSNASLSGGQETVSYTTMSGDTSSSIATALKNAINADSNLQNINVSATSSSTVVSIATATTTYTESTSGGATETITLGSNSLGNSAAVIAGTKTTGDTLTVTAHNAELSGGSEAVTYTVLSGDNLVSIAAGVANAINSDSALQNLGVSASSSNAANIPFSRTFNGNGTLPGGASIANVSAVDGGSNTKTNSYSEKLNSGSSTSLTFDANGNMTSDVNGNTYSWDAENRLIQITYPGSGNYSAFAYDGLGRNVLIQEYTSSSLASTNQFVWAGGSTPKEVRDGSSSIISQFFKFGQMDSTSKRFYYLNQIDSVTEVTDNSGAILGQFGYSPFGQQSQLQGSYVPDFAFAGYYLHARSGLNITRTRAYSANLGRFINRDLIGESGGLNLFAYVGNAPTAGRDPSGMWGDGCQWSSDPELNQWDSLPWYQWGNNNGWNPSLQWGYNPGWGYQEDDSDDDSDFMPMHQKESCRDRCFRLFRRCKARCFKLYPPGDWRRYECVGKCKARYFRCLDRCKRQGQ